MGNVTRLLHSLVDLNGTEPYDNYVYQIVASITT